MDRRSGGWLVGARGTWHGRGFGLTAALREILLFEFGSHIHTCGASQKASLSLRRFLRIRLRRPKIEWPKMNMTTNAECIETYNVTTCRVS